MQSGERGLDSMNMTVVLLLVFSFLLILIGMAQDRPDSIPGGSEAPPILVFSEAEGFKFESGKANLSIKFRANLRERLIPKILRLGKRHQANIIDCIGHTDEQPVTTKSSLDGQLLSWVENRKSFLVPGSNVDLGLMRCLEVARYFKEDTRLEGFRFNSYSAGQVILPNGDLAKVKQGPQNDPARRRIELRLRRTHLSND